MRGRGDIWKGRRLSFYLAVPFLLFFASPRLRGEEPVAVATPRAADVAPTESPEKISDPVLSVVEKLKAPTGKNDAAAADIVELGEGPDLSPNVHANGKFSASAEEPAPPGAPAARRQAAPDDPEFAHRRSDADDSEPPDPPEPLVTKPQDLHPFAPRPGDPETRWRRSDDSKSEGETPSGETSNLPQANTGNNINQRVVTVDPPRYPSGEGLDSDAAELVSSMAIDAQQKHEADPTAPTAPASALALAQKNASALHPPQAPPAQTPPAAQTPADPKKAKPKDSKDKGKNAKKDPIDPEKAYADLIAQYERDKPSRQKAMEESKREAEERRSRYSDLRRRDDRAAMVLDLLSKNPGPGKLSGRIFDAATHLPTPARVRLVDATDLPIDAPLAAGFWTTGEFTAEALDGIAHMEITRGRFRPMYVERVKVGAGKITPFQEVVACPPEYSFAEQGWFLADLNAGLALQKGELPVWLGPKPSMQDLARIAEAEGVQILGAPPPFTFAGNDSGEATDLAVLDRAQSPNVLLLPLSPGPNHPFYGCVTGLGTRSVKGIPAEISEPEIPLYESFEEIHARGGLGVFQQVAGARSVNIRSDIIPLFPRLEASRYYGERIDGAARLYSAAELPFDTVAGPAYDLLSFDGSELCEKLWFNLLNHGYNVPIIGAGGGSLEGGHIPYGNTFIHVEGRANPDSVLAAIKAGHMVVTFGPAVFCRIAERDMGPGSTLTADGRGLTLHIRAYASMQRDTQIGKIEVIRNGVVMHTYEATDGETEIANHAVPLAERTNAWYVVRVTERSPRPDGAPKSGRAWTNPIFFQSPTFSAPTPAMAHVRGILRVGATPAVGTVKAVAPGRPERQVSTDKAGHFQIDVAASGTLIFEAADGEPSAKRIFEHPKIQQALGTLQADGAGSFKNQVASPALFDAWDLLLTDLDWDVSLSPAARREK